MYLKTLIAKMALVFALAGPVNAMPNDNWVITSYCACHICCNKSDGITASGDKVQYGYIACNWLPFGTKVYIEGLGVFVVKDRGAKSLFGGPNNRIKHIDIYFDTHQQAVDFGKQYRKVTILW